jgi:ParB family chromosome partitioning protein
MEKKIANGEQELMQRRDTAVDLIEANPYQPRKHFDADELKQLSASIKSHGILQPILVRMMGNHFQLVAGERRLRAAQEAGMRRVPIYVVDMNDQQAYEASLVENIHRSDLNPIEKALGFKDYLDRFKINHEQLAQRLGLARSTISNLVGLLELPAEVQEGIRLNQITEAHAKLVKGIRSKDKQVAFFKQIVAMGLSVKAAEALMRDQKSEPAGEAPEREPAQTVAKTAHIKGIEDELKQRLFTQVEIKLRAKDKGQFVLRFETNADFERILDVLRR